MGRLFSSTTGTLRNDPVGLELRSGRPINQPTTGCCIAHNMASASAGHPNLGVNVLDMLMPLSSAICRACWRTFLTLGSAGLREI